MASVKFVKGSEEYEMFMDYWKFVQKHYEVEDSDDYWTDALADITKFDKKYSDYPFAHKLALAYIDELEERRRLWQE